MIRHGVTQEIAARELVPGDVVLLDAGSRVPADGRLTEAHALRVEESALTGESVPVDKRVEPVDESTPLAERTSMALCRHKCHRRPRDARGDVHRHGL